jgi:CHAT domain-containing protein
MARKRFIFFRALQPFLKASRRRSWTTQPLLALITVFLCIFISPVFAKAPAVNSAVPSLQSNPAQTESLVQQGKRFYEAGQFTEAVKVLQQAAAGFKATGDKLRQAMTLSNLSLAHQQLGQWPQAEQAIAQSLNLLGYPEQKSRGVEGQRSRRAEEKFKIQNPKSKIQNLEILAQSLDVQGRLQLARGQAEPALATWRQAADTYRQLGDEAGVTRSRINSAQAQQALGLYRQAQKTLEQVNQTLQKQPDSALKAIGLRSLGNVFRVVGNLTASRQVLEQSRDVAMRSPSAQAISDTLLSLGNTARAQQDTEAAFKFYQQAVTASASPSTRIQAQLNQLSLLLETEQWNAAQALWPQIQPQIADLPPSRTAVYARINFAQGLRQLKQHTSTDTPSWQDISQLLAIAVQQARDLADQRAISYALGNLGELYEQTQQWSEAEDLTQQALFLAQIINATDIAYRWQWQLGRLLRNQGNIQKAIAAYTEAVNNLKFLRSDLVAISPDVQFDFRDEVEPVYRELVDLLLQSPQTPLSRGEQGGSSLKNLQTARTTIESLQLAELENFFRSACLDAKPELIDSVVDQEDQTAAVIYPVILPERLEVILKLPTQPNLRHYVTEKSQSEVENTLETLRQYLKEPDRTNDVQQLSQQVYSWLIQPLETELGKMRVTKLVFVLDGALRQIPMAVLYDDKQQKYLIEKYAIALTPGLQLLEPETLQRQRLRALTAGLSESRQVEGIEFPQLENVRLELKQIEAEVPRSEQLLNQEFTKTNIQNQINSTPFTVVHMATHGQFSSNLEETFILTWDQLLKINDLDNLLRTSDSSRSGTIELLVLSACETAAGDNRAALGLAGIAVRAGARSTLATLWSVDDQSTAALMSEFYRQLANTNLTKAEALQRAQLALWNNNNLDWKRPYFWAAYVLVGNWL